MKFRRKMMILLLVIALVPLILSSALHRLSMRQLGSRLATETRDYLGENAVRHLQSLVENYALILERDKSFLQLAIEFQVREAERLLAADPPSNLTKFYSSGDFDTSQVPASLVELSTRHAHRAPDGEPVPVPVSYQEQVYYLAPGADPETARLDMARLAPMSEAYRILQRIRPGLFHWQYTALESGLHVSFPGHGGIPPEYDSRVRGWYRGAIENDGYNRIVMTDATTGRLMMVASHPVRRPDGSLAGVTSFDVIFDRPFADWNIPEQWADAAHAMILVFHPGAEDQDETLEVVLSNRNEDGPADWRQTRQARYLVSTDRQELAALIQDAEAGRAGTRRMSYRGQESLWVYGARSPGDPVPMVIVPYEVVVAQAHKAENYVLEQIVRGLQITGLLLLGVVVCVVLTAIFRARKVTRPVSHLADAAGRLAGGDYDVHVDIRTGDELEDLGQSFNRVGPQLKEREEMKRSLELAREIQQLLLPERPPQVPGLDIAGNSLYCDETGGDYFDFLDLGEGRLGVMVGDVVGHGVGAALLMASASGVLRSHAAACAEDLETLISTLNRFLTEEVGDVRFMTLFYALLDMEKRTLCWISAGHGPVIRYRSRDQALEEIPPLGMPVGIMEDAEYQQSCIEMLEPGDFLAIGTDGIWEARNSQGELFGSDRFSELLRTHASHGAEAIYSAVMTAVEEFRGEEPQDDDVTLVVVKAV